MCRTATCQECGKATWAGCGNHVDQVMRNVPQSRRCTCATGASRQSGVAFGWIKELFGRRRTRRRSQ
ncbi:hypothetical protein AC20117_04745 [Arthrobacter crystallopoietes]|nr:hypothetical protein [Arthrobacter crystallopoietes]AUI50229.1 hypothetical protein AC20117_04745 [Arthrobacter crystallopoietes]